MGAVPRGLAPRRGGALSFGVLRGAPLSDRPAASPSPWSERLRKAGWSALTLLMFLAFLEILARRVGAPDERKNIEMDFNADLMWQLRDDPRKGPEYRVNALGLRGPELEEGDTLRVMSTGDSSIYGHSVRIEEVFTSVVASRLEGARPAPPVEGVIGGIPGYSSYQSLRLLDRVLDEVDPDIVVIGNMWSDAFQAGITDAEWAAQLASAYGPWMPITKPLSLLSTHSALARNVRRYVHDRFYPAKEKANEIGWLHLTKPDPGLEDPTETTENLMRRAAGNGPPVGPGDAPPGGMPGPGAPVDGGKGTDPGKGIDPAELGKGPGPMSGEGPGGGQAAGKGADPGAGADPGKGPDPGKGAEAASGGEKPAHKQGSGKGRRRDLPTTRVPVEEYEANLRALAAKVRASGALPVFLMLPHPNDGGRGLTELEEEYRVTMRRVAEDEKAPLVDTPAWFAAHPRDGTRFADDIHPNAQGHADIAAAALEAMAADAAVRERLGIPAGTFAGE